VVHRPKGDLEEAKQARVRCRGDTCDRCPAKKGLKARNIVRCSRCPWTKEYRHFENHTKRCDGAQAVPVESSDRSRVGQEPE